MNIDTVTEMLIANEGVVLHEYKDHLGYSTLGVGRLIEKDKGGITEEEAKYLLANAATDASSDEEEPEPLDEDDAET